MTTRPFYLNCVDPGGTTGLGLLWVGDGGYDSLDKCVVPYRPDVYTPVDKLKEWRAMYADAPHILVYENFHVRPQRAIPDTTALRVLGEMDGWATGADPDTAKAMRLLSAATGLAHGGLRDMISEAVALLKLPQNTDSPYERIVPQEPVQAKNLVTDEVLERVGLLATGPFAVHINDAHRHAVTWLALISYMPVCTRGWPTT